MALETLRNAGIKIWMLTGDKVETATCIGISSKLIARNQNITQIQKLTNKNDAYAQLNAFKGKMSDAMVIDGQSLQVCVRPRSCSAGTKVCD